MGDAGDDVVRAIERELRIEGQLNNMVLEMIADKLNRNGFAELTWSDDMPHDDPNAPILVVDREGTEYELEFEVWLNERPD